MSNPTEPISGARLWTGRIISYVPALLLLLDGVAKLFKPEPVVKGTIELGFPESSIVPMGIALVVSVLCYLIPQTSVVGAALLSGYLGGAVCTHVHHGDPVWQIVMPAVFSMILWAGLVLREPRLEILLPWKR